MKTPHEFYLETNGRIIDVDGYYGGQCWDLFAYFCQKYCGKTFSCSYSGYVKDFYYHFKELGLDKYFDLITNRYELQDGDWLIWDKAVSQYCWISNYSHIAMFRKYEKEQEQNIILTQNPNGKPNYVYQMLCDFHGFVGALRPKCYINEEIVKPVVELPEEEIDEDEELAIEIINQDKENPLVEFIKWIIKIIQKLMKGEQHE